MNRASPLLAAALFGALAAEAAAQRKPTLAPDDYDRWETLGRAALSPDGRWLAVDVGRVDDRDELRIHRTDSDSVVAVAFGRDPRFSEDGGWLAYAVGVAPNERDALRERGQPARDDVGLLNLRTGERETIEDISSFAFSGDGRYLALRRYAPEGREIAGADALVRDLASGVSIGFGNVAALAWQDEGHLLAMTVDAEDRVGNGVRLYDPASGRIRSLDTDEARYRALSWREGAADLAVLRTYADEEHEDTAHAVLAWSDLDEGQGAAWLLDPRSSPELLPGQRVVEYRAPSWSDDGSVLFVGYQERIPAPEDDGGGSGADEDAGTDEEGGEEAEGGGTGETQEEERAGVEIWHSLDVDPVPQQRVRERQLRQRNHIGAWRLEDGRFLMLGGERADRATLLEGGKHVLHRDETPYDAEAMFGQQFYDLYAVDTDSGRESLVRERLTLPVRGSPGGRYAIWFEGEDWWSHDLSGGETRNLTADLGGVFVDLDVTPTREQMPTFGVSGWIEGDRAVLVNDRWDVWELRLDGAGGRRLTRGAEEEVRHRAVLVDPQADAFDPASPVHYSTYGEWTKRAGFSRARLGDDPETLLREDASFSGASLVRARDGDVFVFRRERFDDSPDYFAAGPDLDDARQVTRTNPFQDDYAWGRTELVEYENEWGRRLQGALIYPAGYRPGRRYPMIVHHYERLSQTLHRYQVPDPTRYYNVQIWSQEGYFVFRPDVVYRDRRPGQSNVETLRPAVAAVLETGRVDPERVGLVGHSWGGYQTTFFVTQDDLFASAVAGAPLTNLMSMYLSFYWNSGGTDARIFEISQGRMQVPWWEDWDSYFANSPIHHIQNLNTPLLMEFGTEDGAVEFNQGVEFYNAARRAGKHMVLLVYEGENHGLAEEANQRDYRTRILEWFGHYLKGEPAPDWIAEGVPYLEQKDGPRARKKAVS